MIIFYLRIFFLKSKINRTNVIFFIYNATPVRLHFICMKCYVYAKILQIAVECLFPPLTVYPFLGSWFRNQKKANKSLETLFSEGLGCSSAISLEKEISLPIQTTFLTTLFISKPWFYLASLGNKDIEAFAVSTGYCRISWGKSGPCCLRKKCISFANLCVFEKVMSLIHQPQSQQQQQKNNTSSPAGSQCLKARLCSTEMWA